MLTLPVTTGSARSGGLGPQPDELIVTPSPRAVADGEDEPVNFQQLVDEAMQNGSSPRTAKASVIAAFGDEAEAALEDGSPPRSLLPNLAQDFAQACDIFETIHPRLPETRGRAAPSPSSALVRGANRTGTLPAPQAPMGYSQRGRSVQPLPQVELPSNVPPSNPLFGRRAQSAGGLVRQSMPVETSRTGAGAGGGTEESHVLASVLPQVVQAIDGLRRNQEEARVAKKGTLGSLRRSEELDVYLARGCDTLQVEVCATLTGKELFHALKRACESSAHLLQQIHWPTTVSNRIAYGIAALAWGGRSHKDLPDWSLSTADLSPVWSRNIPNMYNKSRKYIYQNPVWGLALGSCISLCRVGRLSNTSGRW